MRIVKVGDRVRIKNPASGRGRPGERLSEWRDVVAVEGTNVQVRRQTRQRSVSGRFGADRQWVPVGQCWTEEDEQIASQSRKK